MDGLSRTTVLALAVAFGLAIVGAVVIERSDARVVDTLGLVCVVGGVLVAALTDTGSDDE